MILTQETFKEPEDLTLYNNEEIIIHRKPKKPGETGDKALIIFVHGLGGHRYTKKPAWWERKPQEATWGRFPQFLYDDFPQLDVGLYEYRTLFKRLEFWRSVTLDDEAEVLGGIICSYSNEYQMVILVGHSMGGLLCQATISYLKTRNHEVGLSRIGGLILIATPQTGSRWVPTWLSWFSEDFRVLKPNGEFVTELHTYLVNNFNFDGSQTQLNKVNIPTWVLRSASDVFVDKLSSGLNLPDTRIKSVHGTHTEIAKPKVRGELKYKYVHDWIEECLKQTVIRMTDSLTVALIKAFNANADRVPGPVRVRLVAGPVLVGSMVADTEDGIALFGWFEVEPGDARQKLATFEKEKKFAEIVEAVRCHNLEIKPTNFVQQEHPDNAGDLISKGQDLLWIPASEIREVPTVVKSTIYPCLDLERPPLVLTERIA